MTINKEQIEHLADLARLAVSEEEKVKYAEQLSSILEYFEQLNAIETANVQPLAQVFEMENITREDEPKNIFSKEKVLADCPEMEKGQVRVKIVFENPKS